MIKAIICDDEPATAVIIKHFLNDEHIPIEIVGCAKNGLQAIHLIEEHNPSLIFLDINMPGKNGFQVIAQLQEKPEGKKTKVIILTAFASFQNARQALKMGVVDILPKPVDLEQLRSAINKAIGWSFTTNETVNGILEYIHAHYTENIELPDIAALTFHTESHIARLFKKYMDMTIMTYVHQLRIKEACRLFETEHKEVQETAYAVGYSSLNNFYKYFKRYTEMTPAQYLDKVKE